MRLQDREVPAAQWGPPGVRSRLTASGGDEMGLSLLAVR
jgi:hypothetical protein